MFKLQSIYKLTLPKSHRHFEYYAQQPPEVIITFQLEYELTTLSICVEGFCILYFLKNVKYQQVKATLLLRQFFEVSMERLNNNFSNLPMLVFIPKT